MEPPPSIPGRRRIGTTRAAKRERQRAIRELMSRYPVTSQLGFVELLRERGLNVTQATVSRDIAELGLIKVVRDDRHVYASPGDVAPAASEREAALRRLLNDLPVAIRRSGLTLLLVSTPGMAGALAQAIDDSGFPEPEGTLGGDNTVLVLFADEERLSRWRSRIEQLRASSAPSPVRQGGTA